MSLRDHFRPPVTDIASWEELHGLWPGVIAIRLNSLLPPNYRSGVKIHLGSAVEIDVAAFELQNGGGSDTRDPYDSSLEWEAPTPAVLLDTDELMPPEYEVRVYDQRYTRAWWRRWRSSARGTRIGPRPAVRSSRSATPSSSRRFAW